MNRSDGGNSVSTELYNECKDIRLIDWVNRAVAHEIVSEAVMESRLNKNSISLFEELIPDLPKISSFQHVYVVFPSTKGDCDNVAYILTSPEIVVLTLSSKANELNPTVSHVYGAMTHEEFWEYLDSFPNCYKHMSHGNWLSSVYRKN